jgi:HEXXH motif-containing protein
VPTDSAPWSLRGFPTLGHRSAPGYAALGHLAIDPAPTIRNLLRGSALVLRAPTEGDHATLDSAGERLGWFPDLLSVVWRHLGAIGLLAIDDDDYDQSHSAPELGATILVSIPFRRRLAPLRVAESVVHEAMHLQLSALERRVPLVSTSGPVHSPWRATARPAGGVLHGLYVFACLRQFFLRIAICPQASAEEITHAAARVLQIESEIANVDLPALLGCLTPRGADLVETLA